jgi:predicted nucleic-acid-binding protein
MKYICDTNFIVGYLAQNDQDITKSTKEIFNKTKTGELTLILEQTVFTEIIFVLSTFYKTPRDKIVFVMSELISYKGMDCDKNLFLLALKYYEMHNIHIVDCLLIAQSKITNIPVLTFDKKLDSLLV